MKLGHGNPAVGLKGSRKARLAPITCGLEHASKAGQSMAGLSKLSLSRRPAKMRSVAIKIVQRQTPHFAQGGLEFFPPASFAGLAAADDRDGGEVGNDE
jgi:hypothetical protein